MRYQTAASLTDCVHEIERRSVDESDGTEAALETEIVAWYRDMHAIGGRKMPHEGRIQHVQDRIPSMPDRLLHAHHQFVVPCRTGVW